MNRTAVFVLVIVAVVAVGYLILSSQSPSPEADPTANQQTEQNNSTDNTASNNTSNENTANNNTPDTSNTPDNNTNEASNQTGTDVTTDIKNPKVFVQATIGDADTLDPIHAYDTSSGEVLVNVYENLIQYDQGRLDTMLPMISTQVPTVENGLIALSDEGTMTMTFPIRDDVVFHSGDPLTPEDVAYSFQRIMVHSNSDSPAWIILEDLMDTQDFGEVAEQLGDTEACQLLKESVKVDGNNVIFTFPQPSATWLARIAHGGSWGAIMNQSFIAENGGWDGDCATWRDHYQAEKESLPLHNISDGTGPFKLERWTTDDVIVLVQNSDYWQDPAYFERIELRVVPEFGTRKLQFEQGDIDMIYVDQQFTEQMVGMEGARTAYMMPTIQNTTAFFNFAISDQSDNIGSGTLDGEGIPTDFFTDLDIRKGFSYAFNYSDFVEQVYLGEANQSYGPIPASLPYANLENPRHHFDLDMAEEHFKNAWGGDVWENGFKFSIVYNQGNNQRRTAAQIIKDNVESINDKFQVDVREEPWPTFLDNYRARKIPIWIIGWNVDFPDAHNFIHPYMHTQGNYGVRQSLGVLPAFEGVDDMIMQAARETDSEKRAQIYKDLQQLAYDQAIDIFLVDPLERVWQRTWVNDWAYNPVWPGEGRYFYGVTKGKDGEFSPSLTEDFQGVIIEEWD